MARRVQDPFISRVSSSIPETKGNPFNENREFTGIIVKKNSENINILTSKQALWTLGLVQTKYTCEFRC